MSKKWLLGIPVILLVGYFSGPHPTKPDYSSAMPAVPGDAAALTAYIEAGEQAHKIKPDNEARIIWANDSLRQPTEYAFVYLHGFSASQYEGAPAHTNLARKFGANLFLARLAEHGIDTTAPLAALTAEKYWASAKEALAIGKKLGKKVVLIGTSTGASNALQLAAEFPDAVHALVLLSPNIAINDPNAWILNDPWGLQIAKMVTGGPDRISPDKQPTYTQYWNNSYRLDAVVALEEYLESAMTPETFAKVKQPVLMLYYYKDEANQDNVVKVSAMLAMFEQLGTPENMKKAVAMPKTGNHVLASPFKSNDAAGVEEQIESFLRTSVIK